MTRIPFTRRLLAALTLSSLGFAAQAADFTVAYQTTVDPAKVAQADGAYEKASKSEIDWRKFDGGAEVITAVASGDVQIGYVGSSPLAAAASPAGGSAFGGEYSQYGVGTLCGRFRSGTDITDAGCAI